MFSIYRSHKSLTRLIILISLASLSGCKAKDEAVTPDKPVVPPKLSGYVQKGPFLTGGTVTIAELKTDLTPTGRSYSTTISTNSGYFAFEDAANEFALAELTAEGLYYNEVEGRTSEGPLKLSVITERARLGTVNINVMTHMERDRVKLLVAGGTTFTNAKMQAMREITTTFGVTAATLPSETLNIAKNGDANGGLLSISLVIQARRLVINVQTVMSTISNDMKDDGVLSSTLVLSSIKQQASVLPFNDIRKNLYQWHQSLTDIKDFGIPNFESPLLEFSGLGSARSTVVDIAGRSYRTLRIGTQWWMIDNLKVSRFSNNVLIPNANTVNGDDETINYFTRDTGNGNPGNTTDPLNYGFFYTRAAFMNGKPNSSTFPSGVQGICPAGWHVPSNAEFDVLLDHIQTRGFARSLDVPSNGVSFDLTKVGWRGYNVGNWGTVTLDWAFATTDGRISSRVAENAALCVRCVKD